MIKSYDCIKNQLEKIRDIYEKYEKEVGMLKFGFTKICEVPNSFHFRFSFYLSFLVEKFIKKKAILKIFFA